MSNSSEISIEESAQLAYRMFFFALEALSSSAEKQCELTDDCATAWELKDEALRGSYLVNFGILTQQQATAVLEFVAVIESIPVNDLPCGTGREINLAAMRNPVWEPVRELARQLIVTLEPVTQSNRAYFNDLANAP